ncbi:hypothetical protein VTO42DRAFT_4172 [Malbranchea cinnamomea]
MPLVIPDISNDEKAAWADRLLGKKITEDTTDQMCFAKKDLPQGHRIIQPGHVMTMDFNPNRLNIYVDENNTVTKVKHG